MPRKRSIAWKYFTVKDEITSTCNLCDRDFKNHGNTGNLIDHLRRKHDCEFTDNIELLSGSSLGESEPKSPENELEDKNIFQKANDDSTFATPPIGISLIPQKKSQNFRLLKIKNSPSQGMKRIDNFVADMISTDCYPVSLVENDGFKRFLKELNSVYTLPNEDSFVKNSLLGRYSEIKRKVIDLLDQSRFISVAVDILTLQNKTRYLTYTAHLIIDSNLYNFVLATVLLPQSQTSDNITSILNSVASDWSIEDKIVTFVTSGTPLMEAAIKKTGIRHLPCLTHAVKMIAIGAMKIDETFIVIQKVCKDLVRYFRNSSVATAKLSSVQSKIKLPQIKLKYGVEGNPFSLIIMMQRILDIRVSLSETINELPNCKHNLTSDQWDILEDCVPLLCPLAEINSELQLQQYPIASQIIPLVQGAKMLIVNITPVTSSGKKLKEHLLKDFSEKLCLYEKRAVSAHATLLDPRFKKYGFGVEVCASSASITLVTELTHRYKVKHRGKVEVNTDAECDSEPPRKRPLWSFFDKEVLRLGVGQTPENCTLQDFKKYINMPLVNRIDGDPFEFWENEKSNFEFLSIVAKKYLCVPASSIPQQRSFNKFGLVDCMKKSSLNTKNVDKLALLNSSLKYFT